MKNIFALVIVLLTGGCAQVLPLTNASKLMDELQRCTYTVPRGSISQCSMKYYDSIMVTFPSDRPEKTVYIKYASQIHKLFQDIESGSVRDSSTLQQRRIAIDNEFARELQVAQSNLQQQSFQNMQQMIRDSKPATPPPIVNTPSYQCRKVGRHLQCDPN